MVGNLYCIVNNLNNKKYIGKTYGSIFKRFKEHIKESAKQENKNRPLYKAFLKYGISNFTIYKLGEFKEGLLEEQEILYIKLFNTYKKGYNATLGGDGMKTLSFSKEQIIEAINNTDSITKAAKYLNIDSHSLKQFLKKYNITPKIYSNSILNKEQIVRIKYGKEKSKNLIKELNITKFVIYRIRNNKAFKDL